MVDQRENPEKDKIRNQWRLANLWGLMNTLKRASDSQRATVAEQHGVNASELPGFGTEIPFGNTYVSQSSKGSSLIQAAVLALAAGAIGFGASALLKPPKPDVVAPPVNAAPPPIDVALDWEITPNGEFRTRSIRGEESSISSETSEQISVSP